MLLFCLVTLIHLVGLPVLPKQTGHQTKGGTGDGPDVADAENEIPMADGLNRPDLFEFLQEDACRDHPHDPGNEKNDGQHECRAPGPRT